ncbi:MAG: hypothetical protein ACTSSI_03580 [Candidatus Helarchaeota archaeon]
MEPEGFKTEDYERMWKKLASMKELRRAEIPTHEKIIKDAIEEFQKEHDIIVVGIYDDDGLALSSGLKKFWVDEEVLGPYSSKMMYEILRNIEQMLDIPHTRISGSKETIEKYNLRLGVEVKDITISLNIGTLILSPFPDIQGYILMIVESVYDVALARKNLPKFKKRIMQIIRDKEPL